MTHSHTARMLFAGALLLGVAGAVGACSDPPSTSTTVERTTTQQMVPVQPPSTVTTTHTRQVP